MKKLLTAFFFLTISVFSANVRLELFSGTLEHTSTQVGTVTQPHTVIYTTTTSNLSATTIIANGFKYQITFNNHQVTKFKIFTEPAQNGWPNFNGQLFFTSSEPPLFDVVATVQANGANFSGQVRYKLIVQDNTFPPDPVAIKWLDKNHNDKADIDELFSSTTDLTVGGTLQDYSTIVYHYDLNADFDADIAEVSFSANYGPDSAVVNTVNQTVENIPIQTSYDSNSGLDPDTGSGREELQFYDFHSHSLNKVTQGEVFSITSQITGAVPAYWEDKNNDGNIDQDELFSDSAYTTAFDLQDPDIVPVRYNDPSEDEDEVEGEGDEDKGDFEEDFDGKLEEWSEDFTAEELFGGEDFIGDKMGELNDALGDSFGEMAGFQNENAPANSTPVFVLPFASVNNELDDITIDFSHASFSWYTDLNIRGILLLFFILITTRNLMKAVIKVAD